MRILPPAGAFVSQAELALRADGELLRGVITLHGEVLRDGPTAVPLLSGGTLLRARLLQESRTAAGSGPSPAQSSAQSAAAASEGAA